MTWPESTGLILSQSPDLEERGENGFSSEVGW